MNLFDILGPVMVGPSSSHTAGAVRIGQLARALLGQQPAKAEILLHGSFASTGKGHGTPQALVAGLLGLFPDDPRVPDSFALAAERGLEYTFGTCILREAHPNTAILEVRGASGRTLELQAASLGGGRIMVNKLDGIEVSFSGAFNTLVVRSRDVNGVVSGVTSILYQLGVNVANMSVCRPMRGADMRMVIEVDEHIKPSQVAFLNELPNIISVTYYDKEEEDDGTGFDEGDL